MEIRYVKADPSGNITLIVTSFVPRSAQGKAASSLMLLCPEAEQVGFVEAPENADAFARLQMAGGEFCGNASLSLAACLMERRAADAGAGPLLSGDCAEIPLEVSGAGKTVLCRMAAKGGGLFSGEIDMPLPECVEIHDFLCAGRKIRLPLVRFPGIAHIVVFGGALHNGEAEKCAQCWAEALRVPALGIMFYDGSSKTVEPLVYGLGANTLCWERCCASGGAAVGAYLACCARESVSAYLKQPGGGIAVTAEITGDALSRLVIKGEVRLAEQAVASI